MLHRLSGWTFAVMMGLAWLLPSVGAQLSGESLLEQAFVLDEGRGFERDAAAAAALYRQAADAGDAHAHLRLGYLAETGDGVPQDYAQARAHYQAAADAGLSAARLRLAICHLEGWGGPVDRDAFVRELQAAAEADYAPAQRILATIYGIGFVIPKDVAAGVTWLERAAALDDAAAQHSLGRGAERARRQALEPDLELARTWFQLSSEQEYLASMRAMARTFNSGTRGDRNWELAQRWLMLATDCGDAEAPYTLAVWELTHRDSPLRDANQARNWLQLASERGNPRASEVLQLEIAGRSLPEAVRHVLTVPLEDRQVERAAAQAGDAPTRPPVIYRSVRPVYPGTLRLIRTEGNALIQFVVDTTGRVAEASVVEASHPLFGPAAIEAVKQWRFHPGRRDGRLVNTRMRVPVQFRLAEEQMTGVDGMLNSARGMAERLGPAVLADANDLRMARPIGQLRPPLLPDGSVPPAGSRVLLLIVLDENGRAQRAHVLSAEPESLGDIMRELALARQYQPRIVNGRAVPSNVILPWIRRTNP